MRLFGIGDLHLSLGVPEKPMDIFKGWENYQVLLEENWRSTVQEEDTVVLAGDLSWGMTLAQADADFAFLQSLPGKKVLLWPSRQLIGTSNVTTTPYHARSVIHYGHPSLLKPEGQPSHRYFIC